MLLIGTGGLGAPLGMYLERRLETGERWRGDPARVEPPRLVLGDERAVGLMALLREHARQRRAQTLGIAHEQRTCGVGGAQPLLGRDGVEVRAG